MGKICSSLDHYDDVNDSPAAYVIHFKQNIAFEDFDQDNEEVYDEA